LPPRLNHKQQLVEDESLPQHDCDVGSSSSVLSAPNELVCPRKSTSESGAKEPTRSNYKVINKLNSCQWDQWAWYQWAMGKLFSNAPIWHGSPPEDGAVMKARHKWQISPRPWLSVVALGQQSPEGFEPGSPCIDLNLLTSIA
jgi:hypothetical protein